MAKKFSDLRAGMSLETQAKSKAKTEAMLAEMPLHGLRKTRGLSQQTLAEILHVQQSAVAKFRPHQFPKKRRGFLDSLLIEVGTRPLQQLSACPMGFEPQEQSVYGRTVPGRRVV